MTVDLLKNPQMQFGAITFFAKQHKVDTCGSNGLPLTPNSIIIFGRAQILKTIQNPYLCQYLDIIRGKHERTVVVSQYCGTPLSNEIEKQNFCIDKIKKIGFQILSGLQELHNRNIVHRNLGSDNVLYQDGDVKLFNYGLYYMTDNGKLVSFPILQILYTAPEVYLDSPNSNLANQKMDIWSLGIILAELALNKRLWQTLQLGQRIRKILSLIQSNGSIFERIAREHNCYEIYLELPEDLRNVIDSCLRIYPKDRPTCDELLENDIFREFKKVDRIENRRFFVPYDIFTIKELYHWWQLAGGDVLQELKKQGLIRSSPPILSLPLLVLIEGTVLGQERNPATLYDPRIVKMPLDALYQRLEQIPFVCYYPLIQCKSDIIAQLEPPPYNASDLPLVIKERDPEYQFHRVILLRRLLHGYPFTRDLIVKEAEKDIPPLLRGDIWASLLHIKGDYKKQYLKIDKTTPTPTDRQIEVDIPRCHQYNELLSSTEGHKKLKRILKAWVYKNTQYVYWQGLDSLTAPFIYLNFNDEAKAFACLSAFVPKYLHKFFLKDNSAVIEEYLAKFSQLIAFHDPALANHLHEINFYPQLFAIPWFLTLFSHVFPLYKILHLWDKVLLGDSSYSLHIGLSVLTQLRDRLLSSGFNECILLFSDLPEVDIEKCVILSTNTFQSTPKSITAREHENEEFSKKDKFDISGVTLEELKKERCARISANDVVDLIRNYPEKVLLVDIRNMTHGLSFNDVNIISSPAVTLGYDAGYYINSEDMLDVLISSNPFFGLNELARSPSPGQMQYGFYFAEDKPYQESSRSLSPDKDDVIFIPRSPSPDCCNASSFGEDEPDLESPRSPSPDKDDVIFIPRSPSPDCCNASSFREDESDLESPRSPSPDGEDDDVIFVCATERPTVIHWAPASMFNRSSVARSVNIPFSSVSFSENKIENVGLHSSTLKSAVDKTVVVIGNEETDLELFPTFLLKCNIKRVCVLHGGFNVLLSISPTVLVSQSHNM